MFQFTVSEKHGYNIKGLLDVINTFKAFDNRCSFSLYLVVPSSVYEDVGFQLYEQSEMSDTKDQQSNEQSKDAKIENAQQNSNLPKPSNADGKIECIEPQSTNAEPKDATIQSAQKISDSVETSKGQKISKPIDEKILSIKQYKLVLPFDSKENEREMSLTEDSTISPTKQEKQRKKFEETKEKAREKEENKKKAAEAKQAKEEAKKVAEGKALIKRQHKEEVAKLKLKNGDAKRRNPRKRADANNGLSGASSEVKGEGPVATEESSKT